jgi:hypothetical protein
MQKLAYMTWTTPSQSAVDCGPKAGTLLYSHISGIPSWTSNKNPNKVAESLASVISHLMCNIPIIILETEENLVVQLTTESSAMDTHIGPPAEVGTLLSPYTPLVGSSVSLSARLIKDLSPGLATIMGASTVDAAVVDRGRIRGGVVVIASGPS